jgi:four helix bundle protein
MRHGLVRCRSIAEPLHLGPVQKTTNLAVAARAKRLAVTIYKLTAMFPASERYGLTTQMRRAAVSIGSNIAEGCGRHGDSGLVAFLQIAMGSASELEFQVSMATELGIVSATQAAPASAELKQVMMMLTRLIQALRRSSTPSRATRPPRQLTPIAHSSSHTMG